MTFFEAAIEVLRSVQRPLDYKTITQFAINRQLLGHVGHTPEMVMGACLLRAVQRCDTGALIRLPSGEFALRGWPEEILERAQSQTLPENVAGVSFPPVNVGLLDNDSAMPLLENDDIQFRKAVQLRFEHDGFELDPDVDKEWEIDSGEKSRFEQVRRDLSAQQHEHYNMCAAIVKILRHDPTPMRSSLIASTLSQKYGIPVYEQSAVLAMRADNALRVSRGKRAIFMHLPPDLWTLTENFLARHILKIESKLYDMSRQLRVYSLHALSMKLRELSAQAWLQLASIVLKHLNYTIISQCNDAENEHSFIFRAEESRGLTYIPVIIEVIHAGLVETDDVVRFRELVRDFGYDHGVLMCNGDVSRDALNECSTKELPIYAYSARQIAPIMLDARIGVTPHELPIVFIDSNFFQALSSDDSDDGGESGNSCEEAEDSLDTESLADELIDGYGVEDIRSGEFLFDNDVDILKT